MNEDRYIEELIQRYPMLETIKTEIQTSYEILQDCFASGGQLLVAGNGGSCADADHIVGELMKGFVKKRCVPEEFARVLKALGNEKGSELAEKLQGGLPAISLGNHAALSTAFLNDVDGAMIYAQQIYGYGKPGDILLGISTSGNAKNIEYAAITARAKGMRVIGLTGKDGGRLAELSDVAMIVPETETYKIQELHLPVYHTLCLMLEEAFF